MRGIIKWRGEKKTVFVKIDRERSIKFKKLVYVAPDYGVFLDASQIYSIELDHLRDFEQLEEACANDAIYYK